MYDRITVLEMADKQRFLTHHTLKTPNNTVALSILSQENVSATPDQLLTQTR